MPLAALASFPPCYDVTNSATLLYTVDKMLAGGASEASGLMYNDTNTYQYQTLITICKNENICPAVERQLGK